jgi:predicted transglutaminase-like cysteine proteinase
MSRVRRTPRLAIAIWIAASLLSTAVLAQAVNLAAQARRGLFGSFEFRAESLAALPRWTSALRRIADEDKTYAACRAAYANCPFPAAVGWMAKVKSLEGLDRMRQMVELNVYLNRFPYKEDRENYGVSDYWASPLEFLRRSGDCEDYAITKFVSLRLLGFQNDDLRIAVVMDTLRNLPHAVLTVRLDEKFYVMDSLYDAVLTDDRVSFYVPQYSVNETTRWAHIMAPIAPLVSLPASDAAGERR